MRNQKGITLIALVITIIVLLILAGVSIAMLTGQNGVLTRATEAQSDTEVAEVVERINLELNAIYADVLAGKDISKPDEGETTYLNSINTNLNEKATATYDASNDNKINITATVNEKSLSGYVDASTRTIDPVDMPS